MRSPRGCSLFVVRLSRRCNAAIVGLSAKESSHVCALEGTNESLYEGPEPGEWPFRYGPERSGIRECSDEECVRRAGSRGEMELICIKDMVDYDSGDGAT
jgi:hypothetical protein